MTRQILMNPQQDIVNSAHETVSFDISYDHVPLQTNELEVNEENETSKQPSVPA